MNTIVYKLLDKCVVVYLDDILIFSQDFHEHIKHLHEVLTLLRKYQFFAKIKKCSFFTNKVTFLGHDIDSDGMHINANKITAIQAWPMPTNKSEVQRFVGFA